MKLVRTSEYASLAAVKKLVTRPPLDQVNISPVGLERTKQIFGAPLTPMETVTMILDDIETKGEQALIKYIRIIDGTELAPNELLVSEAEFAAAATKVDPEFIAALEQSIANVKHFHKKQMINSWISTEDDGVILGQKVTPLERVGVYVPGGNAPLISSVVMSTIPPQIAGVKEIVMATPLRNGEIDPHLLVAAALCGVTTVLKAGGAQAIGALAFGTESLKPVDKIVGPGNIFVTLAKKQVYGRVGIDSIAGPSEILIVADETARADFVAADLLSQAEHDYEASASLITTSDKLAQAVLSELEKQLDSLSTAGIARVSLENWGLIVITEDLDEAIELTNIFAPEHLELMIDDPWSKLGDIKHAGAIFLGPYSTEPIGDYIAGPNHILPTNGTARFSSPLTVNDFLKVSSIISYTKEGILKQGPSGARIADQEGLAAHANAIRIRLKQLQGGGNDE